MRDIFEEIFANQPLDPTEAARRAVRPQLRRRFYTDAAVGEVQDGFFPVLLDGRAVRTPARQPLGAPSSALGQALAEEWQAQREVIDPARMPLTRLANTIIDGVTTANTEVSGEVAKYLGSDLVLYRAGEPPGLVERQARHWDPVLAWMRDDVGARFVLAEGVMHVAQPEAALTAAATLIPDDAWRLGAVHAVTTLTGSALLALALLRGRLSADEVWSAAHVDEDWNLAQWGEDALVLERRAFRKAEFGAAAKVLDLL